MSISISRAARLMVSEHLTSDFNDNLAASSADFAVDPFTIAFTNSPDEGGSFFQLKATREDLFQLFKPAPTCLAIWSDEIEDQNWQHPNTFSGKVTVSGELHRWVTVAQAINGEDHLDAIKSALIQTFNGPNAEINGSGVYYNHSISIENTEFSFFLDGLISTVHFTLVFEVTA